MSEVWMQQSVMYCGVVYAGPAEERPASVARRADTHRGCVHISDTAGRPPAAIRDTTQYQILF